MSSTIHSYKGEKSGFTLIELVLSVAVLSIILLVSVPLTQRYVLRNDMEVLSNIIVQDMYRAQSLARAGENDSDWGVYIQEGSTTVFQGGSYATRNQSKDETYSFSTNIIITGQNEYVFDKFSGRLATSGSTTLTINNDSRIISVGSNGVIEY